MTFSVATPLGTDVLTPVGLRGREGISTLYSFELELLAERDRPVPFEALLGREMTASLELSGGRRRVFNGICSRISQGAAGGRFTPYRAEIVPVLWLLGRRRGSRVFQDLSVPDVLRRVLAGMDVEFHLQGTYHPRNYCVQHRETDCEFVSRLMEEEGIFYFFRHTSQGHMLVVADAPEGHPPVPDPRTIPFAGTTSRDLGVFTWSKTQELRSGRVTLSDHHFQLPEERLEARAEIQKEVRAGTVRHQLQTGGNEGLEIYDYPGGYAERFDAVDRGGGERPQDLAKVFEDARRTARARMQEEAVSSVVIEGASGYPNLASGHRFTLDHHPHANGEYVLTSVRHSASADGPGGRARTVEYDNDFTCIPAGLPYRPSRRTPTPVVGGVASAVVVGPPGEEIFADTYGRVKVQFHWDREGRKDAHSSCWIRVTTPWSGHEQGIEALPRVGTEVIVAFEHGDPDRPVIVGSVWNGNDRPPPQRSSPPTES